MKTSDLNPLLSATRNDLDRLEVVLGVENLKAYSDSDLVNLTDATETLRHALFEEQMRRHFKQFEGR